MKYVTGSEKVNTSSSLDSFLSQFPSTPFPSMELDVGRPHEVLPDEVLTVWFLPLEPRRLETRVYAPVLSN